MDTRIKSAQDDLNSFPRGRHESSFQENFPEQPRRPTGIRGSFRPTLPRKKPAVFAVLTGNYQQRTASPPQESSAADGAVNERTAGDSAYRKPLRSLTRCKLA